MNKDIINRELRKDNNNFRRGQVRTDPSYIFERQINTAKEVVKVLCDTKERTNHVFLVAKMQSGKTGTCNAIINIINKTQIKDEMNVSKFIFVSGMNDCGLKRQTITRLKEQVIDSDEKDKFFVLKNSDLLSFDRKLDNSVIIIDESHYGSNENNVLTEFLTKNGIDWKNQSVLEERNIYIISVSATPFSELVSDKLCSKNVITLKTDGSYVGVTEYMSCGNIEQANADDISSKKIFKYIKDALKRMSYDGIYGIVFIRTRKFGIIENDPYVNGKFDIIEMCSDSSSNIQYDKTNKLIDDLIETNIKNNESRENGGELIKAKPLLILVKGAYRAGITIPPQFKDYIYMIYDFAQKSETTAQALLGRMCGYRDINAKIETTKFYVNKKFADMYCAWEKNFEDRDLIPFNKNKWVWVDGSYDGLDVKIGSKPRGNFAIPLNNNEIEWLYKFLRNKKNKLSAMEKIFPLILRNRGIKMKYDYMMEVIMGGKNNYAYSSQTKRFENFTKDSLVFQFRPKKIKKFIHDTNRDYLTKEDIGKTCVSLVLDATIVDNGYNIVIGGKKRLLVYYVEVGMKKSVGDKESMYMPHKDTSI
jgi:hypothetical protein